MKTKGTFDKTTPKHRVFFQFSPQKVQNDLKERVKGKREREERKKKTTCHDLMFLYWLL